MPERIRDWRFTLGTIGVSFVVGGVAGYLAGLGYWQGFVYMSIGIAVNVVARVGAARWKRRKERLSSDA